MRSFRANRAGRPRTWIRAGIGLGLALVLTASLGPAMAQMPRSLLPTKPLDFRVSPEPGAQATPPLPSLGTTPSGPGTTIETNNSKSGISVDALGALTGETVGILEAGSGGFDTDMWQDTPRGVIDSLITLLPTSPASQTLLALRKKLLLSRAAVPAASAPAENSLLFRRVRALFDSGDLSSAAALLEVVPPTHQEEALSKLAADIGFLGGEWSRACDVTAAWVNRSQDRYWQKALVFCEALNSAWERVDFGMRLLIALDEDDEVFFALMRAIGGETDVTQAMEGHVPRPLDMAMARAARAGLPDPGVRPPAPWLIRGYLSDPGISSGSRFALIEQAERAGIADVAEMAEIYQSMPVSPELLESAASVAAADPGPTGRALLFRATRAQGSNFGKAQAIKQAGAVASERRLLGQMARLYTPIVRELNVTSQLGWFAADGALLLMAVDDFEAARPWLGVAEREATFSPEIGEAWLRIWPLARLAAGDTLSEWRADRLQEWWNWIREKHPEDANHKATLLFGLLEALDDPIPSTTWRGLVDGVGEPADRHAGFAATRAFADAIDGGRVGEAVSLLLITFGSAPLETLSPAASIGAVRGLHGLGLEREARQLAFEIALASGL
jgi:hypothetical protein